jgi:hypothetical protein
MASKIFKLTTLISTIILAYFASILIDSYFYPQIIALATLVLIVSLFKYKKISTIILSFIINFIIFITHGLNSPVFFLIYFLLFIIAFKNKPVITLAYSLVLIIFLSQTLNLNFNSVLTLISLLLITPLVYFSGQQYLAKINTENCLEDSETDILLWHSLKLKTGLYKILDSVSLLLSHPEFTHSQKEELKFIKKSAQSLVNSSQKLTQKIDENSDEI